MKKILIVSTLCLLFAACQNQDEKPDETKNKGSIAIQVSALNRSLNNEIEDGYVVNLDHHQMAKEEGVFTPPSIATIFSDPAINTELIKLNPLIGIDLPFKALCYSEADTSSVSLTYTSADFIARRHGLEQGVLESFHKKMSDVVLGLDGVSISETPLDSVSPGYGIFTLKSDFDFNHTKENLKAIVEAQNDTRWFGEVDFQKDAITLGEEIRPATLLLFGGPAPGAKAMVTTPKIGLDAFCQKLLVYEKDSGEIWIAFNDIVAFSELYYNESTKPQSMINQRLKATFTKAVRE